ncbi:MAG: restriction endonuclease subunit S, partial [Bacillota bacterium]
MSNRLKPYDEYKETGLLWLNSVPEHWQLKKIKHLFTERVEKGYPEEPLLAATQTKGVVPKNLYESRTVTAEKDLHLLKLVKVGDFVISLRSFQGGIEYAYYQGIISPAYTVITPNSEINRGYFKHLAKSRLFLELLKLCVTGIREGQNIDYSMLRDSDIPLPPKEEQDQIVRYLDSKLAKINKYIKNKKKLIELLKEQKQAIINQAVTKGLDPNARMKPSGVEWLGDIPEGWEVTQVGKIYDIELGKMLQPNKEDVSDTLEKYLCALNVFWDRIDFHNVKKMWFSEKDKVKYKIEIGDLIVVEGGDVAVSCIWNGAVEPCYIQNAVHRVREKGYGKNKFLYYWLKSLKDMGYIDLICNKATFAHFTKEKFTRLFIFLPPLAEQQQIVAYIESKTQAIDKAIEIIKKEIDLITEYRTSLISAVVTGKVDVRNIEVEDVIEEIEEDVEA